MIGRRSIGNAIGKASWAMGGWGDKAAANQTFDIFSASSRARLNTGRKRLRNTGLGVGGLAVLNAARSPSSGADGMMPMSSGGMTGY